MDGPTLNSSTRDRLEQVAPAPRQELVVTFFVFTLPRSRSFWLSKFLSYRWIKCGHDTAIKLLQIGDLHDAMSELDGTVETGAVTGWPRITELFPDARMVTVHRPLIEVCRSLEKQGLVPHLIDLGRKNFLLQELAGMERVLSVSYCELSNPSICGEIFERCLGLSMDFAWWEALAPINLQIDWRIRLTDLAGNAANIALMKATVQDPRLVEGQVTITEESFASAWPDAQYLAQAHFDEIEPESPRRFHLDLEAMNRLWNSGNAMIFVARIKGELVGYVTWQISFDIESYGNVQAEQGAWFVHPQHRGVGQKLFDYSVEQLKKASVSYIFPHHRLKGRGVDLGPFFTRRGMIETQRTYYKWIE